MPSTIITGGFGPGGSPSGIITLGFLTGSGDPPAEVEVPSCRLNWEDIDWQSGGGADNIRREYRITNATAWDGGLFVIEQVPSLSSTPSLMLIDLASVEKLVSIPLGQVTSEITRWRVNEVAFYCESYPEALAQHRKLIECVQNLMNSLAIAQNPGGLAVEGYINIEADPDL